MATFNNARTIQTKFMLKKALFELLNEKGIFDIIHCYVHGFIFCMDLYNFVFYIYVCSDNANLDLS